MPHSSSIAAAEALLLPTSPDYLRLQAARRGNAGGLIFRGRQHSYESISDSVDELAAWLAARGLGAGDHVAVLAGNEPALACATFALWGIAAVAVPVSIRSTDTELVHLITHSRARALLCDEARVDTARAAGAQAGIPVFACDADLPLRPRIARRGTIAKPRRNRRARPDDLAVLAYTSGTTGAPKGVMISHANLLWSTLACATARSDRADAVGAALSPLSHTPVFVSHLLCRVLHGSTAVLFESFDATAVIEATERFGITDLPLIAGMVFDIVNLTGIPGRVRQCVEKVSVGGAATPMEAKRTLARLFDQAEIIEAYGQSESTNGVAMARGTSVFDRPGTVGRTNPYVNLAVRRADGSLAAPGEEGELVVSGPTVMRGYLRDPEATDLAIRDGWLHTGDLGRRDHEGYFYVTGRVKNLIITGGENVSPVEVEEVLRTHPDVADVAVIGTPHPKWGEQVTAVIVPRNGTTVQRETLIEFAGRHLAGFKKPRRIEFVHRLPRNAANKVQTNLLKEQFR